MYSTVRRPCGTWHRRSAYRISGWARFGRKAAAAVHGAVRDAADKVARMPATYLTYSAGGRIFPTTRGRRIAVPEALVLDAAFLDAVGTMRVPLDLWCAMRRFAAGVEPALVLERTRLMKGYAAGQERRLDEAAAVAAMTWSDPACEVALPHRTATGMLAAGRTVHCVWTGRRLSKQALDIAHRLPWSAWPCGDLWNLMPAHRTVNQRLKRDRLPSSSALPSAGGRIYAWWEGAYLGDGVPMRYRFMQEAAASLPALPPGDVEVGLDQVSSAMEMQRLRLHRDQGIPEWDAPVRRTP